MDVTRKIEREPSETKKKKKKNGFLTALKYIFLVLVVLFIAVGATAVLYVHSIIKDLAEIDPNQVSKQLYESSVIVDSQGRVLEQIQAEGLRKVVKYDEISPAVIDAFVAVEDKTFFTHNGFNVIRMIGATINHFIKGEQLGGVSTITQQLARNVYLFDRRHERSLKRKVEEAYYTIQLEKYLTKEQIIEGYLNLIFFGMESYGVEAAANTYFGKSAKELDYIEAALLVGTVKAPSTYAPLMRFEKKNVPEGAYIVDDSDQFYTVVFNPNCVDRYKDCLFLMHENGKITDQQYESGLDYDIKTKLKFVKFRGQEISSYFSDIVKEDVIKDLMEKYRYSRSKAIEVLTSGGLRIESTIDFDLQRLLESHYEKDNFNFYFGNALVDAVTLFQREYGLEETGQADTPTLDKFCEVTGQDRANFPDEFYAYGEEAEELQLLKQGLSELGFFVANEYFPKLIPTFDSVGNIINRETGLLLIHRFDNVVDEYGRLVLPEGDFEYQSSGGLVLHRDGLLNFYPHYDDDGNLERVQITVKTTFKLPKIYTAENYVSGTYEVDSIYIYTGRDVLVPDEFKKLNEDGDVVISKQFLKENPDFFRLQADGSLAIDPENFVISQVPIVQPQSAMVIVDHSNGQLKALVGGRNLEGYMLFNRAVNPRQPGSAIKPIAVYTAAMDSGKYSPSSVIDDRPVYLSGNPNVRWPVNWYETYGRKVWYDGLTTIRHQVNVSGNVVAALLVQELGVPVVAQYLKNYGITSLVEEGEVNDMNLAALSLGAMSRGISPLEMTQAYACIANDGALNKITSYTRVTNNRGEVLLEKTPSPERVLDPKVAYLVKDLLRTSVAEGLASRARLPNHTAYGKTGTTSDNFDVWFVGFTPYYAGATWFGNDINIPLSHGSEFTADFWRRVMTEIHADLEPKQFTMPDGIISVEVDRISGKLPTELTKEDPRNTIITDIFIRGFEPTEEDDVHVKVRICKESGKLATDFCPDDMVEEKVMVKRPEPYDPKEHNDIVLADSEYDAPTEECDIHNENTAIGDMRNQSMRYKGKDPLLKLLSGDYMVLRPYPIYMMDGSVKILKPASVILQNGDVQLNNGTIIPSSDIMKIIKYTAEQLDEYFKLNDPDPFDGGDINDRPGGDGHEGDSGDGEGSGSDGSGSGSGSGSGDSDDEDTGGGGSDGE